MRRTIAVPAVLTATAPAANDTAAARAQCRTVPARVTGTAKIDP